MKTTKLHGLNAARSARAVWEDNREGVTVYHIGAGAFVASFWMHRDGPRYAEPVFATQAEAQAACLEMLADAKFEDLRAALL